MEEDNGVLAKVPGEFISAGIRELPTPCEREKDSPVRVVDLHAVRDLGDVRVTYELNSYRHGRSRLWHWRPVRADLVGAADAPAGSRP